MLQKAMGAEDREACKDMFVLVLEFPSCVLGINSEHYCLSRKSLETCEDSSTIHLARKFHLHVLDREC